MKDSVSVYHMESVSLSETKPTFGIDKIRLHTNQFHVRELDLNKGWQANLGTLKADHLPNVWHITGEGEPLDQAKWYNNLNGVHVDLSSRGMSVHYNPSTLDHSFNLTNDLERSWEKVKRQLDDLGIQWNEDGARITRTDLTKQKVMEHPSYVYTHAMGLVKGKRMGHKTYGSNAVEISNGQRALVCYDKTLQLREQKGVMNAPDNLLRMEARWTSSKAIGALHTGLHLTNVGELVKASTAHLEDCYNKFLTNHIFRTEGEQLQLDLVKEKDTLRYYMDKHERGAFNQWLASLGISVLVSKFGADLALLESFLQDVGYSRVQVWRLIGQVREAITNYNHAQQLRGDVCPLVHLETLQGTFTSNLHT